eukprot:TRINITY_DN591_c0_g1_i9.p1 TRINITY_DN591_c0_g1~~TRINITY_DN591_c0_g1_i9.p1  ORF type:complete len:337 (-),score=24.29 TRINITY_DN591_c0_g1_i9:192-1061(-)
MTSFSCSLLLLVVCSWLVYDCHCSSASSYCTNSVYATSVFRSKVDTIAASLGVEGGELMAIMDFESGISPKAVNSVSGATGLIQFMPSTAQGLGTSSSALKAMSAVDQLDYVQKYFEQWLSASGSYDLSDLYMSVLWPRAIGKSSSYVLFSSPDIAYTQNSGLDVDSDGDITKSEAASKVIKKYNDNAGKCPSGGDDDDDVCASAIAFAPTTANLNIRTGPTTSNTIIKTVPEGTSLGLLCWKTGTPVNNDDDWIKVCLSSDCCETGYASDWYISCGGRCKTMKGLPSC